MPSCSSSWMTWVGNRVGFLCLLASSEPRAAFCAVDVKRFVSGVIDTIEPTLGKVNAGITLVNRKIHQEVAQHEGALLEQSSHIAMLEGALRTAKDGVRFAPSTYFASFHRR